MIRYTQGNLLEASADALVNTVNEVGVMGKGIALMFRESFPENNRIYEAACKAHEVQISRMLVTRDRDLTGERWIIKKKKKKHWRNPSKLEWIRSGLKDLVRVIGEHNIRSVAVPPLGCGNGGLEWSQVRREIEGTLAELKDVEIIVFEPTTNYQNAPKRAGVQELTPARALIAELVRRFDARVMMVKDRERVESTDVLQVLSLGAGPGCELLLEAVGGDAEEVLDALARLFSDNFNEG